MVYSGSITHTEGNMVTVDLPKMAANTLDNTDLLTMKTTYGADDVSLWTTDTNAGGVGYVLQPASNANVTSYNLCLVWLRKHP